MKNDQKIIFAATLTVALLISGCITQKPLPDYPKYSIPPDVPAPVEICWKIVDIKTKDECFARIKEFDRIMDADTRNYYMAIEYNNPDFCDKMTDNNMIYRRSKCYYDMAIKYNNSNLCDKIDEKVMKYECYSRLGRYDDLTPDMCEGIGYAGIGCYLRLVEHTGNISLCEKVPEDSKGYCMLVAAEVQKNKSICETLEGDNKNLCYFRLGQATGDILLCEKIKANGERLDYCYAGAAKTNNDSSICEKIKNINTREWCKHRIKYENYYETNCDEIAKCGFKDECFYNLARKTNNSLLCEKIDSSDEYNGYCNSYFAEMLENETFCERIKDLQMKDECYFNVGVIKGDEGLCKKIGNYDFKLACMALTRNPNYCNDIEGRSCKSICLGQIAVKWKNISLCDRNYDSCYLQVALYLYKKDKGERYDFSYQDIYGRNVCYKRGIFDSDI